MEQMIQRIREQSPIIHCITNYVTANDMANMILAVGASPIMADCALEAEDIAGISHGLVLNMGTMNEQKLPAMTVAGKKAAALGHPVIFDPVGAGASAFRKEAAMHLLEQVPCSVIRGNISEIRALASGGRTSRGVDADSKDAVTEENIPEISDFLKDFSAASRAVIAVTGKIDLVTDGRRVFVVRNGTPMMSRVTGTGCMLDGVIASFLAANPEMPAEAAAMAAAAFGLCGEAAFRKTEMEKSGTSSFRMHLIDAVSQLDDERLQGGKNIEIR